MCEQLAFLWHVCADEVIYVRLPEKWRSCGRVCEQQHTHSTHNARSEMCARRRARPLAYRIYPIKRQQSAATTVQRMAAAVAAAAAAAATP